MLLSYFLLLRIAPGGNGEVFSILASAPSLFCSSAPSLCFSHLLAPSLNRSICPVPWAHLVTLKCNVVLFSDYNCVTKYQVRITNYEIYFQQIKAYHLKTTNRMSCVSFGPAPDILHCNNWFDCTSCKRKSNYKFFRNWNNLSSSPPSPFSAKWI